MIKIVFATIITAALLAFPAMAETSLVGTNWRFIEAARSTITADIRTLISFDNGGTVSGNSGCNSFRGNYGSGGSIFAFAPFATAQTYQMISPGAIAETQTRCLVSNASY